MGWQRPLPIATENHPFFVFVNSLWLQQFKHDEQSTYLLTTMNFMNSANRVTGQPKGTAAPTLMLWVIIGVATTTLDASDGESDRGDKRPLIGFEHCSDRHQTRHHRQNCHLLLCNSLTVLFQETTWTTDGRTRPVLVVFFGDNDDAYQNRTNVNR